MAYSVSAYVEGAAYPYVRNPARNKKEAEEVAERMRQTAKTRGWRVTVRVEQEDA